MNDDDLMPFGKHKGERMEDVPDSYLAWLWNEGDYYRKKESPLHHYIKSASSEIGKRFVMRQPAP